MSRGNAVRGAGMTRMSLLNFVASESACSSTNEPLHAEPESTLVIFTFDVILTWLILLETSNHQGYLVGL